jgi:benzoylformate decarboxylase
VKWAAEPARAADVPAAFAHAFAIARTPPYGPTFVSVPMDDWEQECAPFPARAVTTRLLPDPAAIGAFAAQLEAARNPVLIAGPEVDREGGWDALVALAERLRAVVFSSPNSWRASFPEDHPLFAGFVPAAPGPLSQTLERFDVIAVFGAPIFTFHVEGACPILEEGGPAILQVTDDPEYAAGAAAGTAVLGDVRVAIETLLRAVTPSERAMPAGRRPAPVPPQTAGLTAERVLHLLSAMMPADAIVAEEAPSHRAAIQRHLPIRRPGSFFTMASGGLGWSLPASVGLALGTPGRRVVAVIGDGSAMYSIQALFSAARERLPITVLVLNNSGYGAMRSFSRALGISGAPGIDIVGLDFPALAAGHGCRGVRVEDEAALVAALRESFASDGPWVIDAAVDPAFGELYAAAKG